MIDEPSSFGSRYKAAMSAIRPDPAEVERLSGKLKACAAARKAGGRKLPAVFASVAVTAAVAAVCIAGIPLLRAVSGGVLRPARNASAAKGGSLPAAASSAVNPYGGFFSHVNTTESPQASTTISAKSVIGSTAGIPGGRKIEITNKIVKQDGRWIYTLIGKGAGPITVTVADGAKTVGAFSCGDKLAAYGKAPASSGTSGAAAVFSPAALYAQNGRLIVILNGGDKTVELFYDTADPANPEFLKSFGQSGSYQQSRLNGGKLDTVTKYQPDPGSVSKNDPGTYIPKTFADGKGTLLPADSIFDNGPGCYSVISEVHTAGTPFMTQAKAILGSFVAYMGSDCFITCSSSRTTIGNSTKYGGWITVPKDKRTNSTGSRVRYSWHTTVEGSQMALTLYSSENGKITKKGAVTLPGAFMADETTIDEDKGIFRILTDDSYNVYTNGCFQNEKGEPIVYAAAQGQVPSGDPTEASRPDTQNRLFVLDGNLNLLGKSPNLTTEWINSVEFHDDKNTCTVKTQDGTVTVDLSDNKNPRID